MLTLDFEKKLSLREFLTDALAVYRVGPAGDLLDPKKRWQASAGISAKGALLVRPDGFVAWRARKQPTNLQHELEQILTRVLCRE